MLKIPNKTLLWITRFSNWSSMSKAPGNDQLTPSNSILLISFHLSQVICNFQAMPKHSFTPLLTGSALKRRNNDTFWHFADEVVNMRASSRFPHTAAPRWPGLNGQAVRAFAIKLVVEPSKFLVLPWLWVELVVNLLIVHPSPILAFVCFSKRKILGCS